MWAFGDLNLREMGPETGQLSYCERAFALRFVEALQAAARITRRGRSSSRSA
jgi:hypothetical protein